MAAYRYKKTKHETPEPGTWWFHPDRDGMSSLSICELRCANGHIGNLSPQHHTVDSDGVVKPSIVCPREGCTHHVWGVLDGWSTPEGEEEDG